MLIYFEPQDAALCGQHLLNNLLQGSYFQASDLGIIAQQLDAQEQQLGISNATGESQNVDESGNFSVQVLEKALENLFQLTLVRETASALQLMESPRVSDKSKVAFVFNFDDHWFCARWLYTGYYVLDSATKQPQPMSATMLSLYVIQMQNEGWTVFAVQGDLPSVVVGSQVGPNWISMTPPLVVRKEEVFSGKARCLNETNTKEEEEEDPELAKALRLSLQEFEMVPQTAVVLEPEPLEGDFVTIQLILPPTGRRIRRRFLASWSSLQLQAWTKNEMKDMNEGFSLQRVDDKSIVHIVPEQNMGSIGNCSLRVILLT